MLRIQSVRSVIYTQASLSNVLVSHRNCCSLSGGITSGPPEKLPGREGALAMAHLAAWP